MGKLKLLKKFQQYCKERTALKKAQLMLLLLFVSSNVFSKSYSQTELLLSFKNTKVESIISFIEKRTDYRFLYQTSEVDLKRRVSINYRGKVSDAVKILFKGSSVYPVIVNKQIILKRKLNFQKRVISGKVVDSDGIPMPDVNVLVNQFERGTSTDRNGDYKITAKTGDKILFTFIGFKDQEVVVGSSNTINITLLEDIDLLEEVVLIGYGKEKRANVATAISTIKGNDLKTNIQAGSSFDRGLEGLIQGVFVTQGSGQLGKGADIIIRGVTSPSFGSPSVVNNNNPMYVIDGVTIFTNQASNPLQSINPEDIESVQVLKDAAATAIYGSRGANGVIIIKTKTGMYDQPTTVNLSFKTTVGSPVNTLDYLNTKEFKEYILALNKNSFDYYNSLKKNSSTRKNYEIQVLGQLYNFGFSIPEGKSNYVYDPSKVKFYNADTNWNDVVFRSAITSTINASVNGGGEKSLYNLSLGYTDQEGILRADKKVQYNARLSSQFDISDKIKLGTSVNYTNIKIKSGYSASGLGNYFTSFGSGILQFRPDLPVYDKNGSLRYEEKFEQSFSGGKDTVTLVPNPLAVTTLSTQSTRIDNSILANIFAEYNITNELMFKTEYSYGVFFSDSDSFKPIEYSLTGYIKSEQEEGDGFDLLDEDSQQADLTELTLGDNKTINSSINYTLEYTKEFNKNTVKGLLGFSHTADKSISDASTYRDFIANIPLPQYAKIRRSRDRVIFNSGLNSYFTRLSYNYDERYGVTGVLRLDRSSRFASKNRNAYFPSIAANWNVHRESFMEDGFLSELRFRASAGLTGSVTVGDFAYIQQFIVGGASYIDTPISTFDPNLANEKLTWEKTREYNIGLDFALKNQVLRGTVDFYHRITSDVVSNDYEVVSAGGDLGPRNNAKMLNKGFEVSLSSDIINNENFSWSVNANASKNINRVLEVSGAVIEPDSPGNEFYVVGREVNLLKGYVVNGIIQTPERLQELKDYAKSKGKTNYDTPNLGVGDYEFKDINGDGTIDSRDITILGSRQADLFGGFNTRLTYRGISFGANFSYALGLESFRYNQGLEFGKFQNIQRYLSPQYRWSPTNTSATLPRLIHTGDHNSAAARKSSADVFDSSYIRLTSLRLGYDLPQSTINNLGFSRVNLYITGTNLATWSNFPGLDPQGSDSGGADAASVDNSDAYPLAKTFSLGVNLKF